MTDLLKSGTFWTAVGSVATLIAAVAAVFALFKKHPTGGTTPPNPASGRLDSRRPDRNVYFQGDSIAYSVGDGTYTVAPCEQLTLVEYGEASSRVRSPNHPDSFKVDTYLLSWDRSGKDWITLSYRNGPVYEEGLQLYLLLYGEKESRVEEPSGGTPSFKRPTQKLTLDAASTRPLRKNSFTTAN